MIRAKFDALLGRLREHEVIPPNKNAGGGSGVVASSGSGGAWGTITGTLSDQTDLQTALNAKQASDTDLTAIAALDSSTAGAIASDGAGWIKKTYAQFKTALTLVKGDVGLGNVDNTSDVNKPVSTAQQTAIDAKVADAINDAVTTIAPSQNAVFDALALKAPLASPTFTGTVTVPTPSNATDAATKAYVDATAQGLTIKASVRAATAAALATNTYLAGVITETGNGALTIDGVTVANSDRVLVKNEVAGANNGIYVVTDKGSGATPFILTRATDMDAASEVPGAFTFVEDGTTNSGSGFVVASSGPFTIGTTAITWTQFSGAGEITAGAGLTKTGNTLDVGAGTGISVAADSVAIDTAVTVDKTTAQTLTNKTLTSPVINTPTGIVKGDVGLGNVDNTSDATKNAATVTLTNKRITKRVLALSAGSATPSINTDSYDVVHITAQSAAITSFTTNLTGTPVDGDTLRISITDNGTARALTWGTSFEASTIPLPTTTVVSTRLDIGFFWNSETSKWRCVASA